MPLYFKMQAEIETAKLVCFKNASNGVPGGLSWLSEQLLISGQVHDLRAAAWSPVPSVELL